VHLKVEFFKTRLIKVLSRAKQNMVRDRSVLHICISMFIVNNVIFSVFFVNYDDNHTPE